MIKEKEVEKINKEKVKFYFNSKIPVHISLSTGKWYNGTIISIKPEYFIFLDNKEGKQLIFYIEIKKNGITSYIKKEVLEKWKKC